MLFSNLHSALAACERQIYTAFRAFAALFLDDYTVIRILGHSLNENNTTRSERRMNTRFRLVLQ